MGPGQGLGALERADAVVVLSESGPLYSLENLARILTRQEGITERITLHFRPAARLTAIKPAPGLDAFSRH